MKAGDLFGIVFGCGTESPFHHEVTNLHLASIKALGFPHASKIVKNGMAATPRPYTFSHRDSASRSVGD